jgi:hypothetical protein
MKCVVAAMVWVLASACALADVYKWTDANGEVHYGDFPTRPNAEKIMTEGQIQQEENAEKATQQTRPPPVTPDYAKEILDEQAHLDNECQHYKNLRDDRLMNAGTPNPYAYNRMGRRLGYGLGYGQQTITVDSSTGMSEIMSGIQKYCQ